MITVYHVQTFYGTYGKTFHSRYHAEKYREKLCSICECVDPIEEMHVTEKEFCMMDIDD